jgi:glycosyltransferase involved in cell wall biosynthesis
MSSRGLAARIPKRFLMMYVRRLVARLVKANVQPSKFILQRQGQPQSILVPHAVDVGTFKPLPAPGVHGDVFLYCGRLVEEKGVHVLLQAVQLCRRNGCNVKLRVRGEGPYRDTLRQLASSLELTGAVTFHRFAQGQDLVDELQGAYALVVPSIWDEVTGIVAMEAMACGTPVIATNVGGLGELAIKGGLAVERSNADSLAEAMSLLYNAPTLREQLGRDATRAMNRDYSLATIGAKHLAIVHRVGRGMSPMSARATRE